MADAVVMPKLGNTVESAIILAWLVDVGDAVSVGDVLCEIETDKATLEVESAAGGVLLARLAEAGDEVPVLSDIAVVGEAGESVAEFSPNPGPLPAARGTGGNAESALEGRAFSIETARRNDSAGEAVDFALKISPRARQLARRKGLDYSGLEGSGPDGRIIERDIEAAIKARVTVTPLAKAMLDSGDYKIASEKPAGARVGKLDLQRNTVEEGITEVALSGARKTIARRMLASSQTTAQLTLNASADARALLAFRRRLKASDESLGLRGVNINDLLMFAVARALPAFPGLNARFENDAIHQYSAAHLGLAVDTERGLLVPVIREAQALSLKRLSAEAHRLAEACRRGRIQPDELTGGSFTVSNLGAFGIESFTPLLNPPQVAILGVGCIRPQAVAVADEVEFQPRIGLSLTIDHRAVDGAPAARFLQKLSANLAQIDLLVIR